MPHPESNLGCFATYLQWFLKVFHVFWDLTNLLVGYLDLYFSEGSKLPAWHKMASIVVHSQPPGWVHFTQATPNISVFITETCFLRKTKLPGIRHTGLQVLRQKEGPCQERPSSNPIRILSPSMLNVSWKCSICFCWNLGNYANLLKWIAYSLYPLRGETRYLS